jgi:hypothetical protein
MKVNLSPKERRDDFYRRAKGLYGFEKGEVVKLLRKEGFESFKLSEIPRYLSLLKYHAAKRGSIEERMEEWKKKLKEDRLIVEKCPIPGCEGNKVRTSYRGGAFPWKCSLGGTLHYHAWAVANVREVLREAQDGVDPESHIERTGQYAVHILEEIKNGKGKPEDARAETETRR